MSEMLTLKNLIDALELEIFTDDSKDLFIQKCRKREVGLKDFINVCWIEIENHLYLPDLDKSKISSWRKNKIENNLKNYLSYLEELALELNKEKIENHISKLSKSKNTFNFPFNPDPLLLTFNSYYGTVVSDIFWIGDITVADMVKISKRSLNLDELGKYTDAKIRAIKSMLNTSANFFTDYQSKIDALNEAFSSHESKLYKGFNLIILTTIEGVVKQLGSFLILQQGLDNQVNYSKKYHSLNSFLNNVPWKADLEISKPKYFGLTGNYNYADRQDFLLNHQQKISRIKVTYKTRLDFLGRKYRESRNALAHGQDIEYERTLQAFINASALYEVLETVIEYKSLYFTDTE